MRMSFGSGTRLIALSFVLILLIGAYAYHAPDLLAYADKPVKSDAIILFAGPDFNARKKEAYQLLNEGYSRYLIVPAFQQILAHGNIPPQVPDAPDNPSSRKLGAYPRYYENTHIELFYARKMMNAMGFRSAILVSSPYHMKRISMIARRVFGEQSRLFSYVPTRYERGPSDLKLVTRELVKICWFRLYSSFINN